MIAKIDESLSALFPSMRPETSVRSASQITTIDTTTLSSCYLPCPGYRYPDMELYLGYSKDFFKEIYHAVNRLRSLGHLVTQSYDHYFQHGYELTGELMENIN